MTAKAQHRLLTNKQLELVITTVQKLTAQKSCQSTVTLHNDAGKILCGLMKQSKETVTVFYFIFFLVT